MKKNLYIAAALAFAAMPAMAQETYESATLMTEDLNGTARYVGMGGAMEALGADISTIGTNPAGIGLFRKSSFSASFGLNVQPEDTKISIDNGKTTASFDQMGFVFTSRQREDSWINFGVNYTKSRDFNQILTASGILKGGAQNKLSYIKGLKGDQNNGGFDPAYDNNSGEYLGYENNSSDYVAYTFNQNDYLNWNALIPDENGSFGFYEASDYSMRRDNSGYIGEYDINVSGNSRNRFYWGFTVGIKDVHYDNESFYTENLLGQGSSVGYATIHDQRTITGQGFNIKGGVIVRPIEGSPFRFGLSVSSPTWYELTSSNMTTIDNSHSTVGLYSSGQTRESYKYKIFTPWKFGASLGHTVDNCLALGLSYEYADYSATDQRNITEEYYNDYTGGTDTRSKSDKIMNAHTKRSLQGVSTIKAGMEYKINPEFAVRVGYNYVSPMYKTDACRDGGVNAQGSYYSSTTDYTNWKSTNRITAGFGYSKDDFTFDVAYVYSSQKGTFYPFMDASAPYYDANGKVAGTETNVTTPCNVKNDRHHIMATIGWRF